MSFTMKDRHTCRPKFARISEEMRRLAVLPEEELLRRPDVTVRSRFGMRAVYRKETIFALLPKDGVSQSRSNMRIVDDEHLSELRELNFALMPFLSHRESRARIC